jgi:uncharacterized protein YlxW (UPF0749 family)
MSKECPEKEARLMSEIDQLQQRVNELELHIQSRENGFNDSKIIIERNAFRAHHWRSLLSLLAAGAFPVLAAVLGRIYALLFKVK